MTRWVLVSVLLTVAALAGSGYVWLWRYDDLPQSVPVHWNIHGEPDQWLPKEDVWRVFLLMPGLMAGVVLLTLLLPWLSPRPFDLERFRGTYAYVMALVVALIGFIHLGFLVGSLGRTLEPGRWLVAGFMLFFALCGNVLGRLRRNFWLGVRTPWTLANETVWNQTHRLAAWLLVAYGLAGLVGVIAGVPLLWCFIALIAVAVLLVVYSLVLYKRLEWEGKVPAAGTVENELPADGVHGP